MPTAEEIVKLKSGPNLDMLVHVHVMEFNNGTAPPYSSDDTWAFKILDEIAHTICDFHHHDGYIHLDCGDGGFDTSRCEPYYSNEKSSQGLEWCLHLHPGMTKNNSRWPHLMNKHICVVSATRSLAICRAALMASPYCEDADCTHKENEAEVIKLALLTEDLREIHDLEGPCSVDGASILDAAGFEFAWAANDKVADFLRILVDKELRD